MKLKLSLKQLHLVIIQAFKSKFFTQDLFPLNKNTISLLCVAIIGIGFFVAGMFEVLDYIIFKALLFGGFSVLIIMAFVFAFKNSVKKNRPEDKLQDDSH